MSAQNYSILIVDDDADIVEMLSYALNEKGYNILKAYNGLQAIQLAEKNVPHLILLDINMPKMNGLETCKRIKQIATLQETKIIFLTAMGSEEHELEGLNYGADDYIIKPIKLQVLIARLQLVLRNVRTVDAEIVYKDIILNRSKYTLTFKGKIVDLARKEFELLYLLASDPTKVFERSTILNKIWGQEVIVGDRTIDVHIRKLRQKLNDEYISTIKGVGYKLET